MKWEVTPRIRYTVLQKYCKYGRKSTEVVFYFAIDVLHIASAVN